MRSEIRAAGGGCHIGEGCKGHGITVFLYFSGPVIMQETMQERNTKAMHLVYEEKILRVTFKENAVIDQKDIQEFLMAAKELVNGDRYAVLTDGRAVHFMVTAAQEMLTQLHNPNRLANAILTKDSFTEKRVEEFINVQVSESPTRRFTNYDEALNWLRTKVV
jgi:hypothetical protein